MQVDFRAASGTGRDARASAGPRHPADDRFPDAEPIMREQGEVDSRSPVAHEHVEGLGRGLEVHGNLATGMPCRVEHRLPSGSDDRSVRRGRLARCDNLEVILVPADAASALGSLARRAMRTHCSIQEGDVLFGSEDGQVSFEPIVLKARR